MTKTRKSTLIALCLNEASIRNGLNQSDFRMVGYPRTQCIRWVAGPSWWPSALIISCHYEQLPIVWLYAVSKRDPLWSRINCDISILHPNALTRITKVIAFLLKDNGRAGLIACRKEINKLQSDLLLREARLFRPRRYTRFLQVEI